MPAGAAGRTISSPCRGGVQREGRPDCCGRPFLCGHRAGAATIAGHVANDQRILASLTLGEPEKLNALLKKLIAGL